MRCCDLMWHGNRTGRRELPNFGAIMTRSKRFVAACIFLLAIGSVARAQTTTHFSLAAGASFPTSTFGDFYGTGYNLLGAIGFEPMNMPIGFRLDGMYQQFDGSNGGPSNRVLSLTGNAVLKGSSLGPYVVGGLGLYGTTPERGNSDTDVGFNVGAGYRFGLTGFSAFLEARYHYVKEGVSFVPLTFGVTF